MQHSFGDLGAFIQRKREDVLRGGYGEDEKRQCDQPGFDEEPAVIH
jgi:hypothetical protein